MTAHTWIYEGVVLPPHWKLYDLRDQRNWKIFRTFECKSGDACLRDSAVSERKGAKLFHATEGWNHQAVVILAVHRWRGVIIRVVFQFQGVQGRQHRRRRHLQPIPHKQLVLSLVLSVKRTSVVIILFFKGVKRLLLYSLLGNLSEGGRSHAKRSNYENT